MNIKTWSQRITPESTAVAQLRAMQAEIDELRAEIKRLTGIAFLASAERDELRMELGDLPEAQADMLATIKVQHEVLERRNAALRLMTTKAEANWIGWKSAEKEIDELRAALLAEVGRVSKDAERYDYLLTKRLGWLSRLAPTPWKKQTTKEAMSSALDAAMKEPS